MRPAGHDLPRLDMRAERCLAVEARSRMASFKASIPGHYIHEPQIDENFNEKGNGAQCLMGLPVSQIKSLNF